jgi:tetratricopeptide (TPR) repeat protein
MDKTKKYQREQSNIVNRLFQEDKYSEARDFILKKIEEYPDDHFWLSRLSTTYYEEKDYNKALQIVEQALKLSPHCPLVLWDYAGALDMLERNDEAIRIYKRLIRRGINRLAYGECGEGIVNAREYVNDSRYRIGLIYANKGKFNLAQKYLREYINYRNQGFSSIYDLREVKKDLKQIIEGKDPRNIKS